MLGNRGSNFDVRWLAYIFFFFFNLVKKNVLRVKNFSKCCENGIACLRKGKLRRQQCVRNNVPSFARALRNPRRQQHRESPLTKGLMSRTMVEHVRYTSWYISLSSSTKQQSKMTKFCIVQKTWNTTYVSPCPRFSSVIVLTLGNKGKWLSSIARLVG